MTHSETKQRPDEHVRLEAAVSKVAKAYEELVKVIERGSTFEAVHIAKSFGFLANVHRDSNDKAVLSLKTAIAANGGFSLDKEYDATPMPMARPIQQAPDRLVGQGHTRPGRVAADDDVGFIED